MDLIIIKDFLDSFIILFLLILNYSCKGVVDFNHLAQKIINLVIIIITVKVNITNIIVIVMFNYQNYVINKEILKLILIILKHL